MNMETSLEIYYAIADSKGGATSPTTMHDFLIQRGHDLEDVIWNVIEHFDGLVEECDKDYIEEHGLVWEEDDDGEYLTIPWAMP